MTDWSVLTLKSYFDSKMDERDKRYDVMFASRDTAITAALAAQEKAVSAALAAQEKALVLAKREADAASEKLDQALVVYKANQNEWQSTFREFTGRTEGGAGATAAARAQANWMIGLVIMSGLNMLGLIGALIYFLAGKH